jgi:flagellar biosynthetic protein FliQ
MTEAYVLSLAQNALTVALTLAAPILVVSLVVGIVVSLVQAATQINEVTMNFIPKLIGVSAVLLILGSWMLQQIITFTTNLFNTLPSLVK